MSSELEDNPDHLEDPSATSSSAETNPSPEKKDHGSTEHAKPRRRRRGKKRKHGRRDCGGAANQATDHQHSGAEEDLHDSSWDSDENLSCDVDTFNDIIIRPLNAPKAPENSTQFIMDDHNDCHFYMSFETPNPYLSNPLHLDTEEGDIIEPLEEDAAYRDIDYQYESPQDFDNTAYYDREFELSYKDNRFEELIRLSRTELEDTLHGLEVRLKEVSGEMVKENPGSILVKLQADLLELQEKNSNLKLSNSELSSKLPKDMCGVHCDGVSSKVVPLTATPIFLENDELSDSSETFHECNDSVLLEDVDMDNVPVFKCDTTLVNSKPISQPGVVVQSKLENHLSVNSTYVNDLSGFEPSGFSLNSQILQHCQPAKVLMKEDLRSMTISNSSDIFHAKCSSSVPKEGGMSPSETSVN